MKKFDELGERLRTLDQTLDSLKRKKRIRNLLKIVGLGFLFYKKIDQEISENEQQRNGLIKRLNSALLDHLHYVEYEQEKITSSQQFLSKTQEEKWFTNIKNMEKAAEQLMSAVSLDEHQSFEILNRIRNFKNFITTYNGELEKRKLLQKILELKSTILQAEEEFNSRYTSQTYFSKKDLQSWKDKWAHITEVIEDYTKKCSGETDFSDKISKILDINNNGFQLITVRNEQFVQDELKRFQVFFDTIEPNPLTEKQRTAIVMDEENVLVVAGAGTGKTSTIVGKACYLVEKGLAKPEEILLIAFNKTVVAEMRKRLGSKLQKIPKIKTYHSLGLGIIGNATGIKPKTSELADDNLKLVKKMGTFVKKRMTDEAFAQKINEYFLYHLVPYKSVFEFKSLGEYIDYIKKFDTRSLKGDKVKSLEECDIANFLYSNGIEYLYEHPYEIQTATSKRRQYMPDFFLPEYGIYIEHFGINREGKTAPYVNQAEYNQRMLWTRKTHEDNQTILIETYSYERQEGQLLTNLKKKLLEKGVTLNQLPNEALFERLNALGRIDHFSALLARFLNLFKSSEKTLEEFLRDEHVTDRERAFIEIFSKIYEDYSSYLEMRKEIDFTDMIIVATDIMTNGEHQSNFKYVLVDEFQDISQSRYRFLRELLLSNDSKLFAVGDDWQSIYRFNGSDISIMVDFEKNFGFYERCFLDETFRFNNELAEFSTKFILQNPIQLEKTITSRKEIGQPAVSIVRNNVESAVKEIICKIDRRKSGNEKVFVIGRYNYLEPKYLTDLNKDFPEIDIKFTSAHKSKGLEADYVILLGLKSGQYGFPCEIVDDPVLNLVLTKQEPYPNAEERRLFYVALTRAKKHVFLVVENNYNISSFVSEIQKNGYDLDYFGDKIKISYCPICKTGNIVPKNGKHGTFYSCNNYPYCKYVARTCPECKEGFVERKGLVYKCSSDHCSFRAEICPACDEGYLIRRNSERGPFFGCSNFPECRYTQSVSHKDTRRLGYIR